MTRIAVTTEEELIDAVRAARASARTLEIVGAGTKRNYGRPLETADVLDLSGFSGIAMYEPEELVMTARAGTPLTEIEAALAPKYQRLGFDPADWGPLFGTPANAATIAGALSADISGSARMRFGAARDHLLGFRAVSGFGEAYKAGGRVVKNVTGFDLPKLMCGAMGTLGPMSEVTLRLVPRAPLVASLAAKDMTPEQGLALIRRVWASPLEATGLAFVPAVAASSFEALGAIGAGAALMRVEGTPAALKEKVSSLRSMIERHEIAEIADDDAVFARIGSGAAFAGHDADVWRMAVPPASSVAVADALTGTLWFADWAGSLFWIGVSETNEAAVAKLRHIAWRAGGHTTLMRANPAARATLAVFPPEDEAHAQLTRSVKAAFDPLGLFNPGRMFEGV